MFTESHTITDNKPTHCWGHYSLTPPPPARVWPHSSTQHTTSKVDLHTPGNVTLCLETFATIITLEIPHPTVSIETRNGKKSFATLIIPDTTAVCQGVCGEGRLMDKFLATLITLIIPDTTAVCQGVCGEVR